MFCWLPSHVGIKSNEAADVKAKASLDLEISNFKLPCTDFKPFINRYILANTLGETFFDNSSSRNYSEKFQNIKKQEEKIKLIYTSSNTEEYNSLFNITELKDAIAVSKDTATGPDDIHYQMLKHLLESALDTLLHIFNGIWTTGVFPESWHLATIIPIPKPDHAKDHAEPTNYRPIPLTSCLCRTLERMINKRLVWYLESNNLITKLQSGFRAERSTNDNLIRLETFIRDAFIKRERTCSRCIFRFGKSL